MNGAFRIVLSVAAALMMSSLAQGAISVSLLGTAAPPMTLSGFGVTPAPPDPAPIFADVVSAPLGAGQSVFFSSPLSHRRIGSGWATWSHGYTGDVYVAPSETQLTMTFSVLAMKGFYFYVESQTFGPFTATIAATDTSGTTATSSASGHGMSGATGFGVVATGPTHLSSITVTGVTLGGLPNGYAIGEFGWVVVPAPGGLGALGAAALCGRRRRR